MLTFFNFIVKCRDKCKCGLILNSVGCMAESQSREEQNTVVSSVVSFANVSFERTNLLSERSELNHFMN